jgi:hypothetical protein
MVGEEVQRDSGHKAEETTFHWCAGYRRLRDFRCKFYENTNTEVEEPVNKFEPIQPLDV